LLARLPRPVWIWLILVIGTLLSFESSLSGVIGERVATTLILLIAMIKVRFVALEFMELRHAPIIFRAGLEIWLVILFATMITLYWLGPG
jgi:hypothetical protein